MSLDLFSLPRDKKIALIAKALAAENERRAAGVPRENPARTWARRFAGRPTAFVAELMPAWLGSDWLAWRSFVKTLFGELLEADELEVFRRCTGLDSPPEGIQREVWIPVGRRGGKSQVEAFIALYLACCCDWTPYLAPGEKGKIVVMANTKVNATAILGYVKGQLAAHSILRNLALPRRVLTNTIEMEGSVEIEIVTASIGAARSRTIVAALLDEIAFWRPDETCANPDVEIIRAIRPAMITIPNSMQIAASSRYARKGVLWEAYRDHYGKTGGPLVWSASTKTMHPSIPQSELDKARNDDPIAFEAEYGEEFRSDVAAFVTREVVEAAVQRGLFERPPQHRVAYQAFCDPSGGSGTDSMTLAIAHREEPSRGVLDLLREVQPPFNPHSVAAEFAAAMKSYGIGRVRGDHYAGDWPIIEFQKNGIVYEPSADAKSAIYQEWLPMLNASRCSLLDNQRLIFQAESLERRTSRVGKDTIDHPPAGHDDVVNAAAGALVMAAGGQPQIIITDEALMRARMPAFPRVRRYG